MGQVSALESWTYTWTLEGGKKANIKREVSNPERGLEKKAKNQSLPGHAEEKDFLNKHGSPLYEYHD